MIPALTLFACNEYPVFRVSGFEQAAYNNNADILFVIDNSDSMQDNVAELALNFNTFLAQLTSAEGSEVPTATLSDAVGNYLKETNSAGPIDYQLGITTTTVDYTADGNSTVDAGEAGLLIGPVIAKGAADVSTTFRKQLLCDTANWKDDLVASDATYAANSDGTCPDPVQVSQEYLDCMCGVGGWGRNPGSGNEEGIEAALMALCRAAPEGAVPETCYDEESPFIPGDEASNAGLVRAEATTLVVIVTDEGDNSRRGASADNDVEMYLEAFDDFDQSVRFAIIGPPYPLDDDGEPYGECLDGAQPWGVERYQTMASDTYGAYYELTDVDYPDCTPLDFAENLESLGQLLNNLQSVFPLQASPDVASILVYVDEVEVAESALESGSELDGTAIYGDGWTYDAAENAVTFHGAAIPDYNQDVRIYYEPTSGVPRDFPL
jgi:hypothetical protein